MKKIVVSIFMLLVILSSTIGYKIVSAKTKINEVDDIITYQQTKEKYLTPYNYTIDNPNTVLNPYGISPLTALIMFETPDEEEVTITVQGKDKNSTYTNTFEKTRIHYIPVLGLYPDYDNEITLKTSNKVKKINIKTTVLPTNLNVSKQENNSDKLNFISEDYLYAVDNNNDVRWYLTKNYQGQILTLKNGHIMLGGETHYNNNFSSNLLEIDLLGKVYKEYNLNNPYYNYFAETNTSLLVLSKNLLEIDKQTGTLIREIELSETFNYINYTNNMITLENNAKSLEINYKTEEKKYLSPSTFHSKTSLLKIYNMNQYKIEDSIVFDLEKTTKESKANVLLLNYKKTNAKYDNYNVEFIKEPKKLVTKIKLDKNDSACIILDKFLGKKVYDLKDGYNYINDSNLSGNYSIYLKVNDDIYKTDNYVTF